MQKEQEQVETLSELDCPQWSVVSTHKVEGTNLVHSDAVKILEHLVQQKVDGLCIITDEAAARMKFKEPTSTVQRVKVRFLDLNKVPITGYYNTDLTINSNDDLIFMSDVRFIYKGETTIMKFTEVRLPNDEALYYEFDGKDIEYGDVLTMGPSGRIFISNI